MTKQELPPQRTVLSSKPLSSCRRLLITVKLQLPWVQPELQWPCQLLPVLTGWLQSEHRAQHELPVQIKAQAAPQPSASASNVTREMESAHHQLPWPLGQCPPVHVADVATL